MDFEIIKPLSIDLGRDSRKTGPRREYLRRKCLFSLRRERKDGEEKKEEEEREKKE